MANVLVTVRDDIWLCIDCMHSAVTGETLPDTTAEEIESVVRGLDRLGPNLVPDFDSETGEGIRDFSACGCDCCGSRLAGEMHRFAVLGHEGSELEVPAKCLLTHNGICDTRTRRTHWGTLILDPYCQVGPLRLLSLEDSICPA